MIDGPRAAISESHEPPGWVRRSVFQHWLSPLGGPWVAAREPRQKAVISVFGAAVSLRLEPRLDPIHTRSRWSPALGRCHLPRSTPNPESINHEVGDLRTVIGWCSDPGAPLSQFPGWQSTLTFPSPHSSGYSQADHPPGPRPQDNWAEDLARCCMAVDAARYRSEDAVGTGRR